MLRRSRARALVTVNGFLDTDYVAMLPRDQLPDLETVIVARTTLLSRGTAGGAEA